jgi:hypothetical protein
LTFLEDRRALYNPYDLETPEYVVRSILDIRERLTSELEQLEHPTPLAESIRAMRAACRKFLDQVEATGSRLRYRLHRRIWDLDEINFFLALGELRAIVGIHAAQISVRYGIDVEETLVSIFPASPMRK